MSRHANSSGNDYSTNDWLDNHHAIKSRVRAELVHSLPIAAGSRILDLGCGTGNWTFMLAEKTGHAGNVVGVDRDRQTIAVAENRRKSHYLRDSIHFNHSEILQFKSDEKFDSIILFNSISYIRDIGGLFAAIQNLLSPGGSLYIKDSDLGTDFFWPVDVNLYHDAMCEIEKYAIDAVDGYDPFCARKLPKYIRENGYTIISTISQSHTFVSPIDAKQKVYVRENALMISDFLNRIGRIDLSEAWRNQFSEENADNIFTKFEFLYSMTEFVFQAKLPSNS